jgi:polar amino acid transport system permease protein
VICPPPAQIPALELLSLGDCGWGANLLWGLGNSVVIALGAYAVGFAIGIAGAFGKLYGGPILKDLLATYTTLVRAVPELVLILILYYAFTGLLNEALLSWGYSRVVISPILTGIAVLGVVQGAYQTEVIRGGILAPCP